MPSTNRMATSSPYADPNTPIASAKRPRTGVRRGNNHTNNIHNVNSNNHPHEEQQQHLKGGSVVLQTTVVEHEEGDDTTTPSVIHELDVQSAADEAGQQQHRSFDEEGGARGGEEEGEGNWKGRVISLFSPMLKFVGGTAAGAAIMGGHHTHEGEEGGGGESGARTEGEEDEENDLNAENKKQGGGASRRHHQLQGQQHHDHQQKAPVTEEEEGVAGVAGGEASATPEAGGAVVKKGGDQWQKQCRRQQASSSGAAQEEGDGDRELPQSPNPKQARRGNLQEQQVVVDEEEEDGSGLVADEESLPPLVVSKSRTASSISIDEEEGGSAEEAMEVTELHEEELEEEKEEVLEEFNPFFFIKHLPPYQHVAIPGKVCLPQRKFTRSSSCPVTLVLDLDETLVHCTVEPVADPDVVFPVEFNGVSYQVHVRKRPYLDEFLARVSKMFEVVVFTASQQVYADALLDIIDPMNKLVKYRLFRDACLPVDGNYIKDLNVLGRDIAKTVLVDNSPYAYGYQIDNGIPIESWFEDRNDMELLKLIPFLEELQVVEDVRPLIRNTFQTFIKVHSA